VTDLLFDPDAVGADMVAVCRISDGPRHDDPHFDPAPGDAVLIDDGAGEPLRAVVLRRLDDEVLVRIPEPHPLTIAALRSILWPHGHPTRRRRRRTHR
jgi:hypothetical protein